MTLRTQPVPASVEASPSPERSGASGDPFADYVLPEVDTLYRAALSLTRNHADAEDLVQDTLLRAYRSIDRFDGRHPRAWLLTILRNAHINRQRRPRPELLHDPDVTWPASKPPPPPGGMWRSASSGECSTPRWSRRFGTCPPSSGRSSSSSISTDSRTKRRPRRSACR